MEAPLTALEQIQKQATALANTAQPHVITVTFDPDRYEPWTVTAPFLAHGGFGETIEEACRRALTDDEAGEPSGAPVSLPDERKD